MGLTISVRPLNALPPRGILIEVIIGKAIAMKPDERHEWRVDDRCIGWGASVSVAPELIVWNGDRAR
jgi:hypothetical protein